YASVYRLMSGRTVVRTRGGIVPEPGRRGEEGARGERGRIRVTVVSGTGGGGGSAEPPGDVLFGFGQGRALEDLLGGGVLDEAAEVHEGGVVGDACGLLHVVGDDEDGVALGDLVDEFLDAEGGD